MWFFCLKICLLEIIRLRFWKFNVLPNGINFNCSGENEDVGSCDNHACASQLSNSVIRILIRRRIGDENILKKKAIPSKKA